MVTTRAGTRTNPSHSNQAEARSIANAANRAAHQEKRQRTTRTRLHLDNDDGGTDEVEVSSSMAVTWASGDDPDNNGRDRGGSSTRSENGNPIPGDEAAVHGRGEGHRSGNRGDQREDGRGDEYYDGDNYADRDTNPGRESNRDNDSRQNGDANGSGREGGREDDNQRGGRMIVDHLRCNDQRGLAFPSSEMHVGSMTTSKKMR